VICVFLSCWGECFLFNTAKERYFNARNSKGRRTFFKIWFLLSQSEQIPTCSNKYCTHSRIVERIVNFWNGSLYIFLLFVIIIVCYHYLLSYLSSVMSSLRIYHVKIKVKTFSPLKRICYFFKECDIYFEAICKFVCTVLDAQSKDWYTERADWVSSAFRL